jgi:hypothetical protein
MKKPHLLVSRKRQLLKIGKAYFKCLLPQLPSNLNIGKSLTFGVRFADEEGNPTNYNSVTIERDTL